jgi:Skp family chaperone for outer membrane proteins
MKISIILATVAMTTLAATSAAFAQTAPAPTSTDQTQWQKDHPRRTEVNDRLANQNQRINNEVKSGQISKSQGAALHNQDHQVRQEERDMASQNGGHITKGEQQVLNKQENHTSKEIGK